MTDARRDRRNRVVIFMLVGIVPAALLGIGVAKFTLNHFFAHAPYLLDSGWYSDIVWHAGLWPRNPVIAFKYAEYYYGVHPSPYVSLWSALSYLSPLRRIEWYALFQAFCFVPFGFAVYFVSSKIEPESAMRRLALTMLASLAFAFHGQILKMVGYPHYEGAIAAYGCLWLGTVLTGRRRLAWLFFVLAISVREDAGLHMALAITPLLYLQWRGVAMPVQRRTLLAMVGAAIGVSVALIMSQKLLAHGPSILKFVYLGDPIYSHLSWHVLGLRAHSFVQICQPLYYPLLATVVIAIARRDARYLLGWVPGVPWFLLNFLAYQPQKATFEAYAHFPYILSLFWVFAYGALLAPAPRRFRAPVLEALFALVCLSSTLGLYRSAPAPFNAVVADMKKLQRLNRSQTHEFVDALGKHRAELGHLYVDYSVAALALESITADNEWTPGVTSADTIAFHQETVSRDLLMADIVTNRLASCVRVRGTGIMVCTKEKLPAGTFGDVKLETIPAVFAFANLLKRPWFGVSPRGVWMSHGAGIDGYLGRLPAGTYTMTWTLDSDLPADGTPLFNLDVMAGAETRASASVAAGARSIAVQFDASGDELLWFRSGSAASDAVYVTQSELQKLR